MHRPNTPTSPTAPPRPTTPTATPNPPRHRNSPPTGTFTYDLAGHLTTTYTPDGSLASRADAAGTTTFTYSTADQLTGATAPHPPPPSPTTLHQIATDTLASPIGTSQASVTYGFDLDGRLTAPTGLAGARTTTQTYDARTTQTSNGTTRTTTYDAYDEQTTTGTLLATTLTLAYNNPHGDLLATFARNGSGITSSTAYNPFGAPTATTHDLGYQGAWTDTTTGQINMPSRW